MNKIFLFILLIFTAGSLKAQSDDQSLSIGLGAGAAQAYAGAPFPKTTFAYNAGLSYYITPFINIGIEGQAGTLAAGVVGTYPLHLNFTNQFQAAFAAADVHFGAFLGDQDNWYLNIARNIYIGAGLGAIHNNVTEITTMVYKTHDVIPAFQTKLGYVYNIKDANDDTFLKIDLSFSYNPTIGRGLDGYYGHIHQDIAIYTYTAIGIAYLINFDENYGGKRLRF